MSHLQMEELWDLHIKSYLIKEPMDTTSINTVSHYLHSTIIQSAQPAGFLALPIMTVMISETYNPLGQELYRHYQKLSKIHKTHVVHIQKEKQ